MSPLGLWAPSSTFKSANHSCHGNNFAVKCLPLDFSILNLGYFNSLCLASEDMHGHKVLRRMILILKIIGTVGMKYTKHYGSAASIHAVGHVQPYFIIKRRCMATLLASHRFQAGGENGNTNSLEQWSPKGRSSGLE